MKLYHNWILVDAGLYDSIYQCTRCKKRHMQSVDNPESRAPQEGCTPSPKEISVEIKRLQKQIAKLEGDVNQLRACCTHPNVKKKHGSNTGNWCPQDDCYWTDFDCPDCGKHWTEDGSL